MITPRDRDAYRLDLATLASLPHGTARTTYRMGGEIIAALDVVKGEAGEIRRTRWVDPATGEALGPWQSLTWRATRQPGGGERLWLACPLCDGRARVLRWFGGWRCGACHPVRYAERSALDHAFDAPAAIRTKLGGSADLDAPFPARPLGMRRKRYADLMERHDALQDRADHAFELRIARLALGILDRYGPDPDAPPATPEPRSWGRVTDYVDGAHDPSRNRPVSKPMRPDCIMVTVEGRPCRAKAKPGFTICHRHLERVRRAELDAPALETC